MKNIRIIIAAVMFALIITITASPLLAKTLPKPYVGDIIEYDADFEDTFVYLARDYKLGFTELRAANPGVDPWVPGAGTDLILPTRHLFPDVPQEGIVINLAEMRLYAFFEDGKAPVTFPLGVGREGLETPLGITKIVRKASGPVWYPTPRMREADPALPAAIPPGPENPLGSHALYLGWPQYAIHGTNRPFGIGRRISSGCIRMYPEAIVELYKDIPVGTPVRVISQPYKTAWIDNTLYLEASPSMDQSIEMEETGQISNIKLSEDQIDLVLGAAGASAQKIRWDVVKQAFLELRGYPVAIAKDREHIEMAATDKRDAHLETAAIAAHYQDAREKALKVFGLWVEPDKEEAREESVNRTQGVNAVPLEENTALEQTPEEQDT